jgi:hypothetical protein
MVHIFAHIEKVNLASFLAPKMLWKPNKKQSRMLRAALYLSNEACKKSNLNVHFLKVSKVLFSIIINIYKGERMKINKKQEKEGK